MRKIDAPERRRRLGRRHRLAAADRAGDVVEAARSLVCLHATDPASVYLSAWARTDGMGLDDMERALYAERSLVKHLAMRRTLFAFPRETLPFAQAGASDRVAELERRRLIRDVEKAGLRADGDRWLTRASEAVAQALAGGREATSSELRDEIPLLEGSITYGEGKSWGGRAPIGPRLLTVMSAQGRVVRATNAGVWTTSRPRWALMSAWLGAEVPRLGEAEGVAGLVERWLRAFGPGTEADIKWWLGSAVRAVRRALAELEAVEVDLGGETGYVLPDDLEPTDEVEPWAALLPPLDPTTMGWSRRDFYLGDHGSLIFDSNGNAGPTMWCDGHIVGGWRQSESGEIELQPLEDVGSGATAMFEREAARIAELLAGTKAVPRFPTPLSKAPTAAYPT